MNNIFTKTETLMLKFMQLNNSIEKQIYSLDGINMFPSEIKLLLLINTHKDQNLTSLSNKLHITKAALSKTIKKLLQKDLVKKYEKEGNKKSIYFKLTNKGINACKVHDDVHQSFDISPHENFKEFCIENELILTEFINHYSEYIDYLNDILKNKPWEEEK